MGVVNHEVRETDYLVNYVFTNQIVARPVIGTEQAEQARHYWNEFFFGRPDGRVRRDITGLTS